MTIRRAATDRSAFRADIEGMRAIAVVSVMAWHAGLPLVRGGFVGVDIFFVISGFLMTTVLLREVDDGGRIGILHFYQRRIRRLLPAAATALAGTAVLTVLLLPAVRWRSIGADIGAAALYVVNWRLADNAVDYLGQGQAASPVQHFWSLSVEEQFYLVLPVAVALVCLATARAAMRRRLLVAFVTLVVIISLGWSVRYTAAQPGQAYFVTTTRMWELALGGLVALAGPLWSRLRVPAAAALAWIGLAAMIAGIVVIDATMPFPGATALLPTLGAAMVLAAGSRPGGAPVSGPVRLLRPRPVQQVGALSYSLYLWHWPILVAAAAVFGRPDGSLAPQYAVIAIVVCLLPAWLSYRFVEERLRRPPAKWRPGRAALVLLVACTALSITSATGVFGAHSARVAAAEASPGPIRPDPVLARDDLGEIYAQDCQKSVKRPIPCWFGPADAPFTVALVGDSHAAHYFPPVQRVAAERGWRLLSLTRPSCPVNPATLVLGDPADASACHIWQQRARRLVAKERPDLVITTAYSAYKAPQHDAVAGFETVLQEWIAGGSAVVVLADTPSPGFDIVDCVDRHRNDTAACAFPREDVARTDPLVTAAHAFKNPAVSVISLADEVCPGQICEPVIDGVLVYRDGHHLTRTFALGLALALDKALAAQGY